MTKFYDTNALLTELRSIFEQDEKFLISNITKKELESIKTSMHKDADVKYRAREATRLLNTYEDKYDVIKYKSSWDKYLKRYKTLADNNDSRIIISAIKASKMRDGWFKKKYPDLVFVTGDGSCYDIAKDFLTVQKNVEKHEESKGFIVLEDDGAIAYFYTTAMNSLDNVYNLKINEYVIISADKRSEAYRWIGCGYEKVAFETIKSKRFGEIKPKDIYQQVAIDSMRNNIMTVIRGNAGSGKSLLGLSFLFQQLERHEIEKIIMFINPVATKDSCKFGFLPGELLSKILGSQIGNFLSTKLGSAEAVMELVEDGLLQFIPVADARGVDTTQSDGAKVGVYVTEGQNTNREIMRIICTRIGENTIAIIEGDDEHQTDAAAYDGSNNGLRRLCEVFGGEDYFGHITLQKCYRSRIAEKSAEL